MRYWKIAYSLNGIGGVTRIAADGLFELADRWRRWLIHDALLRGYSPDKYEIISASVIEVE